MASAESETHQQKHARLARQLLDQADQEMMAGDLLQSSEKLWGATGHALKAFCESRGWRRGKYAQRHYAARQLAEERDDRSIFAYLKVAESCHANFYNDWMELQDIDENRVMIRWLVDQILVEVE